MKLGRTKGNKQKAEYGNLEANHGKPGRAEEGKPGSESGREAWREAAVRLKTGSTERKKQKAK